MTPFAQGMLIASMPPTIAAVGALVLGWLNRRAITKTSAQLSSVETKVDGRLTELLELTRKASRAEGEKAELDRDKS